MGRRANRELAALERIVADDHARRELRWLRAKEKEDDETARDLERLDPELVGRLAADGCELSEGEQDGPHARRDAYARLWHARYAQLSRRR